MRSAIRYTLAFVVLVTAAACDISSAKTPPSPPKQMTICGTLGDTVRLLNPQVAFYRTGQNDARTEVKFNDGRTIMLIGTPEITVSVGKFYVFTVDEPKIGSESDAIFRLRKTAATNVCGYDRDTTKK